MRRELSSYITRNWPHLEGHQNLTHAREELHELIRRTGDRNAISRGIKTLVDAIKNCGNNESVAIFGSITHI